MLYFYHPLKLGDYIKIIDKDLPMEGTVEDISMYFRHIKTIEGERYTIPKSLVLQKILTIAKRKEAIEETKEAELKADEEGLRDKGTEESTKSA